MVWLLVCKPPPDQVSRCRCMVIIRGLDHFLLHYPLYVVDGVPYGAINAINPNDIESMTIIRMHQPVSVRCTVQTGCNDHHQKGKETLR